MEREKDNVNAEAPKPHLLDQVREAIRVRHYSIRTEQSYVKWIKNFILYHKKRHPQVMGEKEINAFLTHLAVAKNVAASTQNQALCAILFLYKEVLKMEIGEIEGLVWAKKPSKIPVVFTRDEARRVIEQLNGDYKLMVLLLYGAGLRLMECLRLRVQDIDLGYNQITVRNGKGDKDRVTILPKSVEPLLKAHLINIKKIHDKDLQNGCGEVYLPYALEKKYPNANREWKWQYVFPATQISKDPRSGKERRHHIHESVLQRVVKTAIRKAGIQKHAGCHTFAP